MNWRTVITVVALATLGLAPAARAQYFGQNKVQYEKFDFKVLKTAHFDIYYYAEEEAAVQIAARMAERWYVRLSKLLNHELSSRQPLILYAAHPHFQQTNVLDGQIGEGTGGVTESAKRRIVLPFAGGLAETDHVVGHELVHAFQYDIAADAAPGGSGSMAAMGALPLWFIEGMAEYLSLGPVDAHTAMWVREASARERMPTVDRLDDPDFFPYRYGHAFWAYVAARWGDRAVGDMLYAAARTGSVEVAIETILQLDKQTFTTRWHEDTRRSYATFFEATQIPGAFGRAFMTKEQGSGDLNVAPAISPDGRQVVFLSERGSFSVDMYVADIASGKVTRHLVKTAGDPHFESLQFIESAGDWAPDNRRFVFAALAEGRPVLTIVDTTNGKREVELPFPDLDQIFNPAWSPDGKRVAFSAMHGGVLDLYVFDIASKQTTALTNDAFADLDPEWNPDGLSLAWVTDRFTAKTDTIEYGNYRIGLLTVATRDMRPLATFENGRSTNPEFSEDGQSLYFIGTPEGIANIYRVAMAGGTPVPVTNLLSGVSGITPLTPALSVAAKADTLVFTAFEGDHYNLYVTENASKASTRTASSSGRNAAILPPSDRKMSEVAQYLESPAAGLPKDADISDEEEYNAGLTLDGAIQPTVGVGVDRFGAYGGGGLTLVFSDMLGNHVLATSVQITNRLEDTGGSVMYLNRTHRWNWGLSGEYSPYTSGGFSESFGTLNGQTVVVQEERRYTQVNRGLTALLQYPFSRSHRVELSGGYRNISFHDKVDQRIYAYPSGNLIEEREVELPTDESLNLGEASAALVYDSAIVGPMSPILGQRYRLELTQSAGTLTYSGILADYRKYLMPVRPLTIALRGMHYGRYGRNGEDGRLQEVDLGFPGLVRGYDLGSFDSSECGVGIGTSCPVYDQLFGSRIAVANAELRFPLFGIFTGSSNYGPLPLEGVVFGDAGVAWSTAVEPRFLGGNRDWVRSFGAGIRFNLLGFLIGEMDWVKPLDRPEKGWHWQFNFIPGF